MTDYFTHEDAVEPALAVLCEVLKRYRDIGAVLKNDLAPKELFTYRKEVRRFIFQFFSRA